MFLVKEHPILFSGRGCQEECAQLDSFTAGIGSIWTNEEERTLPQTSVLRSMPYLRSECRKALHRIFREVAFRFARSTDAFRYGAL
jgi:hypothetical protein